MIPSSPVCFARCRRHIGKSQAEPAAEAVADGVLKMSIIDCEPLTGPGTCRVDGSPFADLISSAAMPVQVRFHFQVERHSQRCDSI